MAADSSEKSKENQVFTQIFRLDIKSSNKYLIEFFNNDGKRQLCYRKKNLLNIPNLRVYKFYPLKIEVDKEDGKKDLDTSLHIEHFVFNMKPYLDNGASWTMRKDDKVELLQTPEEKAVTMEVNEKLKFTKYSIPYCKFNGKIIYYEIFLTDNLEYCQSLLPKKDQWLLGKDQVSTLEVEGFKYNYKTKEFEKTDTEKKEK
jgi:hypothetical protein